MSEFLFDDFFVAPDDPGIEKIIKIKGREVPIRFKRAFSLDDIQTARTSAVQTKFNFKTKQAEISGIDEGIFMKEMLFRAIVSWPFIDRSNKKIPITRETIGQMKAEVLEPLSSALNELIIGGQQDLSFFENQSGEAS